jgi:hypothetical protein
MDDVDASGDGHGLAIDDRRVDGDELQTLVRMVDKPTQDLPLQTPRRTSSARTVLEERELSR